jgi:hypothetical protein
MGINNILIIKPGLHKCFSHSSTLDEKDYIHENDQQSTIEPREEEPEFSDPSNITFPESPVPSNHSQITPTRFGKKRQLDSFETGVLALLKENVESKRAKTRFTH